MYCFSTLPIFIVVPLGTSITASYCLEFFHPGTNAVLIFALILFPAGVVVTKEPSTFAPPP
ncbi:MAG: hypothetical protein E6Y39_09400 [Clostridium butyricum]|nr:hypothetical protein [Clostridium butyricum]